MSPLPNSRRSISNPERLDAVLKNVGTLFIHNFVTYPDCPAFSEKSGEAFDCHSWSELVLDIVKASVALQEARVTRGDRIAIISSNSYYRMVMEMAIMSCGMISVPLFPGYSHDTLVQLLTFSKISALIVEFQADLKKIDSKVLPRILVSKEEHFSNYYFPNHIRWREIQNKQISEALLNQTFDLWRQVESGSDCLIMYTSGTSQFPKGVQLSHSNILTQQAALAKLWKLESKMRFLCYLPWHHSFGGLFERFFALATAGHLHIDDSQGKNVPKLIENFKTVKPHVYFSVPKVYQEIISVILTDRAVEDVFFHAELKFVFTAAAPLPLNISEVFKSHQVPVVEGWGLTETSPCCTLTPLSLDRKAGVVGFPIPQTEIKLSDDGEILVRGPQVMRGYFENDKANADAFDWDGWFKTGDIGEISESGLKLLSRKDRMFKLANGEKIFPNQIEDAVKSKCSFIKFAYLVGKGESELTLLVFPNFELMQKACEGKPVTGCESPKDLKCLSKCLSTCLGQLNASTKARFEQINTALIWDKELTIENNELTPSFKLIPRKVDECSADILELLKAQKLQQLPEFIYLVQTSEKVRS